MKEIPLTQGKVALVDDADFEAISQFKWRAAKVRGKLFYALRNVQKPDGKWTTQSMHQFLLPGIPEIDHRDGDGLNNQRENLRKATRKQNRQGAQQKKNDATSKFRGVTWLPACKKWQVAIGVDGKVIYLGRFLIEEDAARARDVATLKYHGKFAHLNFP